MTQPSATQPPTRGRRRSLVVLAEAGPTSDSGARALAASLADAGVEVSYIGRETSARKIAAAAADLRADAVEVCVVRGGKVGLLRELLHVLREMDRRGVSIVVHRIQ